MSFAARNATIILILAGGLTQPAAAHAPSMASTSCTGKLGYEYEGDVIPGIEIYPGIFTGMSREEAKRVRPDLVGRQATVELFPRKRMVGQISFENYRKHGVADIDFKGPPFDAPTEELTQRFGKPLKIDFGTAGIQQFNHWMPGPRERFEVLKWCDGRRIYVMRTDEEGFELTISGPRTRN
jgi:hypothetical protein